MNLAAAGLRSIERAWLGPKCVSICVNPAEWFATTYRFALAPARAVIECHIYTALTRPKVKQLFSRFSANEAGLVLRTRAWGSMRRAAVGRESAGGGPFTDEWMKVEPIGKNRRSSVVLREQMKGHVLPRHPSGIGTVASQITLTSRLTVFAEIYFSSKENVVRTLSLLVLATLQAHLQPRASGLMLST
jgi:hypothetical protein